MSDLIFLRHTCYKCVDRVTCFTKKSNLRRHILQCHGVNLPSGVKGALPTPPNGCTFTEELTDECRIYYLCPSCVNYFDSLEKLGDHVTGRHAKRNESGDEDDPNESEEFDAPEETCSLYTVKPTVDICAPASLILSPSTITNPLRCRDEAVVFACNKQDDPQSEKVQAEYLVESLGLEPFSMMNKAGSELNGLVHKRWMDDMIASSDSINATPPVKKRRSKESDSICVTCSPSLAIGLERLLAVSPYRTLLQQRQYIELAPQLCELINKDWCFFPNIQFVSAMMFAGSILLNTANGQAALVNTVEIFGRTKTVDVYREGFGKLKSTVQSTSLPPTTLKSLYPGVWPATTEGRDGKKLVIGTEVSNVLVTSCLRLDTKLSPVVGSSSSAFDLSSVKNSVSTKIFLDKESLDTCLKMAATSTTTRISDTHILYQLRQIRSKFDQQGAYQLCRASGPLTKSHIYQPYTVFTIADYNHGRNPTALLFRTIAELVLKNGLDAKLTKSLIQQCVSKSKAKGQTKPLECILCLYNDNNDPISILDNAPLNENLETLANLLMPSIVAANATVARYITAIFD